MNASPKRQVERYQRNIVGDTNPINDIISLPRPARISEAAGMYDPSACPSVGQYGSLL